MATPKNTKNIGKHLNSQKNRFKKGHSFSDHPNVKETQFKKGGLPPNWNGGRRIVEGYVYILSKEHPNSGKKQLVAEHRLVMEKFIGRYLTKKEVVHHIDGNRQNNSINNLMLFPNQSAHFKFRHIQESIFICKFCKKNQKDD